MQGRKCEIYGVRGYQSRTPQWKPNAKEFERIDDLPIFIIMNYHKKIC